MLKLASQRTRGHMRRYWSTSDAGLLLTIPEVSSIWAYYEATAISGLSDGDPISQWNDLSGNGRHATMTGSSRPLYREAVSGNVAVDFAYASAHYFNLPNLSALTSGEAMVVVKLKNDPPTSADDTGFWLIGTSGDAAHVPFFSDGVIYDNFGSDVRKTTGDATDSFASWTLYNPMSKSGEWTARINSEVHYTTGTNSVGFPSSPTLGRSYTGPYYYLNGYIAAFYLFSAELTSGERVAMETYIAAKFGVAMS